MLTRIVRCAIASLALSAPAAAQDTSATEALRAQAEALEPLVETQSVRAMLDATGELPEVSARTIYRSEDRSAAHTEAELDGLDPAARDALTAQEFSGAFYYNTAYGSPLVYARPLDIAARAWETDPTADRHAPNAFAGRRILDFGYGTVGHLRLLASLGADCVGTEVQPLFRALYSWPGDQGVIDGVGDAPDGHVRLLHGRWPGELADLVGGGYDLFISKNVLKRGYIHPAREVDARFLVDLGVDDATFLSAVHGALRPGGLMMIYNISPAQNPPEERYLPHADGQCPFTREQLETAGFEVLEFDAVDIDAILGYWSALGYDRGQSEAEMREQLFAWYTLARRC